MVAQHNFRYNPADCLFKEASVLYCSIVKNLMASQVNPKKNFLNWSFGATLPRLF